MFRTHRTTSFVMLAALFAFTPALDGQERRTKRIRVEVGSSSNHGGSDTGFSGAVRYAWSLGQTDHVRIETGLVAGNPFAGLDGGIELRVPQRGRLGLLARAGGGLLVEDGYAGLYVRGGGGLEVDLTPRVAARGTWQAGMHDGRGGPHVLHFGFDYRW